MSEMTADLARSLWSYDPDDGQFRWLVPARNNQIPPGTIAGALDKLGYHVLCFRRKKYGGGRIAWLIMTGAWPAKEIDHIDGNPSNNKWSNLREATRSQQLCNTRVRRDNALGVKGVCWGRRGKYEAYVSVAGNRKNLGSFATIEEAKAAYDAAARERHGEFAKP